MKLAHKIGVAASVLTLATGLAASTASAATAQHGTPAPHTTVKRSAVVPSTDTDITGYYAWNGNGYRGDLNIYNEVNGTINAVLSDNGYTEYLIGHWDQASNTLTLTRTLPDRSATQYYTYFLGGGPLSSHPKMFGGYFTSTATGSVTSGTYLDSAFTF